MEGKENKKKLKQKRTKRVGIGGLLRGGRGCVATDVVLRVPLIYTREGRVFPSLYSWGESLP